MMLLTIIFKSGDIIQSKRTEIDVMDFKHKTALDKQENAINHTLTEIKQVIQDFNDVSLISKYQSRIGELRKLTPKLKIPSLNSKLRKSTEKELLNSLDH